MKVKLSEILEGLELANSEITAYVNIKTGQVVLLSDEDVREAEKNEDIASYPDWQREIILVSRQICQEESKDFIPLPREFDINEYRMMQDFIDSLEDDKIAETLQICIKGSGAFRRFKDAIYPLGVDQQWFKYKDDKYRELAIDWCNEKNLEYTED